MAALEWRVVSELLRSKDMVTAKRLGLSKHDFRGAAEAGQIYEYVAQHYNDARTYRQFPLLRGIKKRWPAFTMTAKSDEGRLATLIRELKDERLGTDLNSAVAFFGDIAQSGNPLEAIEQMQSDLAQLRYRYTSTGGFGINEIASDVRESYKAAQLGANYGVPWPWEALTRDTLGKNNGDLIAFYGRMKSMKTWLVLFSAAMDFMQHKRRVLIWSREMNRPKLSLRLGSIIACVDYQCLKHGSLPGPLFERGMMGIDTVAKLIDRTNRSDADIKKTAKRGLPDLVILCGREAPRTLEEVRTACEIYGVEIAYLDSFYHLVSERSQKYKQRHEQQLYLAEDTKSAALDLDIPFVVSTQANREGERNAGEHAADVAGTDALAREVDALYRVIMRPGPVMYENEYEGYWSDQIKRAKAVQQQMSNLIRIKMKVKPNGHAKGPSIARGPRPTDMKDFEKGRKSAEIAIIANGNREGVLDGMLLHVVPGYMNKVLRDDFTAKEAKIWMKRDDEDEDREYKRRKGKEERPQPTVGVGKSFSNMPKQHFRAGNN